MSKLVKAYSGSFENLPGNWKDIFYPLQFHEKKLIRNFWFTGNFCRKQEKCSIAVVTSFLVDNISLKAKTKTTRIFFQFLHIVENDREKCGNNSTMLPRVRNGRQLEKKPADIGGKNIYREKTIERTAWKDKRKIVLFQRKFLKWQKIFQKILPQK